MKILRLDLLAYGPFTRETLDFSHDRFGLHLVYGPNEAGKSTALRALHRLLYGIPLHCDDFLHPGGDLRIGATLIDKGEPLVCVRRRGKAALREADDVTPLDSSRLDEMLAGLNESAFHSRFGIDYHELVQGGQEVCIGKGDLGQLLFAAASGVADLGNVLKQLDKDTGEIFKPKGRTDRLNQAVTELKEVKRRLGKSALSAREWNAKQDEIDAAEQECKRLKDDLTRQQSELRRVQGYSVVQADLSKREQLLQEQALLGGVPLLPKEFSQRRQNAQDQLIKLGTQAESAEEKLSGVTRDLGTIVVPIELLAVQDAIDQAIADFAAWKRDVEDRLSLMAQHEALLREAQSLRNELAADDPQKLRLRRAERLRIQKLATESQSRLVQAENCRKALAKIDAEIQRLTAAVKRGGTLRDPEALKRTVRRAQSQADLAGQIERLEAEWTRTQRRFTEGLGRLGLWTGSGSALIALALPSSEAVDRAEAALRALDGERIAVGKELAANNRQLADLGIDIDARRRVGQVLTQVDLEHSRARRNEGWSIIKRLWLTKDIPEEEVRRLIADFPPATDSAAAYEASVQRADDVSDRLRREAEEVAELDGLQLQERKATGRQTQLAEQLTGLEQRLAEELALWRQLWQPLDIVPQTPAEMRGWTARAGELIRQAEGLTMQQEQIAHLQQTAGTLREELLAALAEFGQTPLPSNEPLSRLIQTAEQLAESLSHLQQEHKQSQQLLLSVEEKRDEARHEAEESQKAVAKWQEQWTLALAPLGLPENASPEEVSMLLTDADSYFEKLKEAETIQERITGIDLRARRFVDSLAELVAKVAGDLAALSTGDIVGELRIRLETARRLSVRQAQLQEQQLEFQTRRDEAQVQMQTLQRQLAAMCAEALCERSEELAGMVIKSDRKRQIESELQDLHDRFLPFCQSQSRDEFISAALAQPPEAWHARIAELDQTIAGLHDEHTQRARSAQAGLSELKSMDGNNLAADAEQEVQQLLAKIRSQAEEYARLKVAGILLRKGIERYREKNQGPILRRASKLFADLTLGSFVALQPGFDDDARPVLVGVRPGGKHVHVEGMSDGTRDQLYLALRLASLEKHVQEQRPIPFIVDDILINFDDERAIAALQTLAQLAQHTQVIFFTHHEHLLALAEEHLPSGEFFILRLSGSKSTVPAAMPSPLAIG